MFKKLCLTSVSAVVFLGAFSPLFPTYGMEEDKKNEKPSTKQSGEYSPKIKEDNSETSPSCQLLELESDLTWNYPDLFLEFANSSTRAFQSIITKMDPLGLHKELYSMRRIGHMLKTKPEDRIAFLKFNFTELQKLSDQYTYNKDVTVHLPLF